MADNASTTKPVWVINQTDKDKWLKDHKSDAQLKKKFEKFEKSVTDEPTTANPHVKQLKGALKDIHEYKVRPVRGLYKIDFTNTELALVDFDYKGNIKYKK